MSLIRVTLLISEVSLYHNYNYEATEDPSILLLPTAESFDTIGADKCGNGIPMISLMYDICEGNKLIAKYAYSVAY